jgi:hypothetical protein
MVRIVLPEEMTPMLLETAVLLALAKLVQPRTFFEFGTLLGVETLNMAANLPLHSQIYTLDLDETSMLDLQQDKNDKSLSEIHMLMRDKLAFLGTRYGSKITRLYGDSNRFDFSPFHGRIDMVYVDGGHDLRTLTSDTTTAYDILSRDHPACIAWHDFGNPRHPAVGPYLSELSATEDLFHVEETMMVFTLAHLPDLVRTLKG